MRRGTAAVYSERTAAWFSSGRRFGSAASRYERLSVCLTYNAHESPKMLTVSDFTESIAEAARTLHQPRSLDDTLQTIVEVACNSVPGFDQVGIATLNRKGKVETRASTGDLVLRLDEVQYDLREGPCSAALQGEDTISVSSLRHEQRWPQYVPQARAVGVRSQMAVKLDLDQGTVGGMNFYSTICDEVSADAQALAGMFATHAAIALRHAHERQTLQEGLLTRKVIGQAIGILMERYEMTEDRAFAFLVRASSHANIKLRAVAQGLVDQRNAK
jgi:GAF domain-containing protein